MKSTMKKDLPVNIRINDDFDQWSNEKQILFIKSFCEQLKIPKESFKITNVENGNIILHGFIRPPTGEILLEKLTDQNYQIKGLNINLMEFGLQYIDQKFLDAQWNKIYNTHATFWRSPLSRGGEPYYCPLGWSRYGIQVTRTEQEFDERYGNWHIAYHGTNSVNASAILSSGLKAGKGQCWTKLSCVYLSPSIEYCAHPRYAEPWKKKKRNTSVYYQLIFQCRVNPFVIKKYSETILAQNQKTTIQIDKNFNNNELEWIVSAKHENPYITDNIVCYGMMLRTSEGDPVELESSHWWKHSNKELTDTLKNYK